MILYSFSLGKIQMEVKISKRYVYSFLSLKMGVIWGHVENFKFQIFQVIFYSYSFSRQTFCRQLAVVPMAMEVCRGVLEI